MPKPSILRSYGSLFRLLERESGGELAGKRILEIGCGPRAPFVQFLRGMGFEAYGIDLVVDASIKTLKDRGIVFQGNAERLGEVFKGKSFDYITSRELMHVPGRIDALLEDPQKRAWAIYALENRKAELERAARKSLELIHMAVFKQLANGGKAIHVAQAPNKLFSDTKFFRSLGYRVLKSTPRELVLQK
ncbi:MAG: methyltransferase domain-containing protein [Candidatus Micrarchaeia archaeon]